ncbi:DUF3052 domain-containing protein [Hyunsoonleella sp. SJ7]|uniref:DUF3052 domain-containing protein n=1 Tax=Hyunsoonleella aquatilis TaxID=2762758 RepID=A0A923HAN8_9FLAO|nr:DUF3052 domain-containing protein [Hyunsoonleella aquatilis]MBC3758232.1 DUF3052 domain-containing protein [Hyunsoonleella aquatilis]
MEGYSGTPLAKKLGIKNGFQIYVVHPPKNYYMLFHDLPENIIEAQNPKKEKVDFIHAFFKTMDDLKSELPKLKLLLKKNGLIWVSWPKGKSNIPTDLNRDIIRTYMLNEIKLVDVKVAAIDKDWSGLKFVYRKEDRI